MMNKYLELLLQQYPVDKIPLLLTPYKKSEIFRFLSFSLNKINVIIVGQDPYPTPGIANGIAFACPQDKIQASMRIIMKELGQEIDTTLQPWIDQGVLPINSSLTVEVYKPGSMIEFWKPFMEEYFTQLDELEDTKIVVFLGKVAAYYEKFLSNHVVLKFPHPAADAYGKPRFVGSGIFNTINDELIKLNKQPIEWTRR